MPIVCKGVCALSNRRCRPEADSAQAIEDLHDPCRLGQENRWWRTQRSIRRELTI
jgi:hypothetical protein